MLLRSFLLFLLFPFLSVRAQDNFTYYKPSDHPAFSIIGLLGSRIKDTPFLRLPAQMEAKVSKQVWRLAKHTAGISIAFATDASEIIVRYKVGGGLQMHHMPATGVSGIDLYAHDKKNWIWIPGKFSFGDTVIYRFRIDFEKRSIKNYQLYLPLYNSITWLDIGISKEHHLSPAIFPDQKPVVVYGTSIAQGACASRPGLAWTAILERELNRPLINLGFSGNGLLDSTMLDFISQADPAAFILDCLPNLMEQKLDSSQLTKRYIAAIRILKKARPKTPLIITLHPYYPDKFISQQRFDLYNSLNRWVSQAIDSLRRSGYKGLYVLTPQLLGIGMESTVDGVHPNDHGMFQYAGAYEKLLKKILN